MMKAGDLGLRKIARKKNAQVINFVC